MISEDVVNGHKSLITSLLQDQRVGPELRVQDFDEYMPLVNGEVAAPRKS